MPQFHKVLDLVNGQIQQVNEKFGPGSLKVLLQLLKLHVSDVLACIPCRRSWIQYLSPQVPKTIAPTGHHSQATNEQVSPSSISLTEK